MEYCPRPIISTPPIDKKRSKKDIVIQILKLVKELVFGLEI